MTTQLEMIKMVLLEHLISNLITEILGDDQSNEDFTVTFHLSQDDADDIINSGISFPFSNTVAFSQPIHVRVLSNKTECFNSEMIFNALVAPLPVLINSNIVVEQCMMTKTTMEERYLI